MFDMVILLSDQGVYGLAKQSVDGIECQYFIDGCEYIETLETDQFAFISYLE